ncbi:MAG: DUF397 domain-containing protein [Micromonosporaceae bacterium]|nr:DUF397 domain-containing protein [Micromonosporaceae bacterium]
MASSRHNYPPPPPLTEFGEFRTHDGHIWDRTDANETIDNNCVAIARHPDGSVCLADTKQNLADQQPLFFTPVEWSAFEHALTEGRI